MPARPDPWAMALLLGKRRPKEQNVLIGDEGLVTRALAAAYHTEIHPYSSESPALFSTVKDKSEIPLEEQMHLAFWQNPPIVKNKDLIAYIVSIVAPTHVEPLTKYFLQSGLPKEVNALYWTVTAAGEAGLQNYWNKQPWEDAKTWMGNSSYSSRLATLYTDLRAHLYTLAGMKADLLQMGISFKKQEYLKGLKLDVNCVVETLHHLAQWRLGNVSSEQAVFLITAVWSNS